MLSIAIAQTTSFKMFKGKDVVLANSIEELYNEEEMFKVMLSLSAYDEVDFIISGNDIDAPQRDKDRKKLKEHLRKTCNINKPIVFFRTDTDFQIIRRELTSVNYSLKSYYDLLTSNNLLHKYGNV